jgi:hypothetical protein
MVKHHRKHSKHVRKSKRKNLTKKSKLSKKSRSRKYNMKGGDDGRFVLPLGYFSADNKAGYYAEGSGELNLPSNQQAVSQGTTWCGGEYAGPNLYPQLVGAQTGGGCGCGVKRKNKKSKSKSKSKSKKHSKSK